MSEQKVAYVPGHMYLKMPILRSKVCENLPRNQILGHLFVRILDLLKKFFPGLDFALAAYP